MKRNAKVSDWVAITVFLMLVFMVGLWQVDVSVSAMNMEGEIRSLLVGNPDPVFTYHLGLCIAITSFFTMALIAIHHVLSDNVKKREVAENE